MAYGFLEGALQRKSEFDERKKQENAAKNLVKKVDIGLNKGKSWESISKDTGVPLSLVKQYSEQTRPGYGIKKPESNVIGDFGKSLVEGATSQYRRIGEGTAEVVNELSGNAQRERDVQAASDADTIKTIRSLGEKIKASTSEEEKQRYRQALSKIVKIDDKQSSDFIKRQEQIAERTDPAKGAGAVALVGLDALTAGTLGTAAKGATGLKIASKGGNIGKNVAVGGSLGGSYGALGTLENQGSDASVSDYALNTALGTGIGAALPGVIPGAKKVFRTIRESRVGENVASSEISKKIQNMTDNFVSKVVDDTNYIKKPFKGLTNSDTGRKITDEIEGLVTNVRQFAGKSQQRLQNNQAYQQLGELIQSTGKGQQRKKAYKDIGDFISRKQDAINHNKLIESGQREGALAKIPIGNSQQEQAYNLLNRATKDDVQYLFNNGIIDEPKYRNWMADEDYTRVQREVQDDLQQGINGSRLTSGTPVTSQKLKGSTAKQLDPFAAYEDWQRRITLDVERNNLSRYLRDQSLKYGKANQVETTSTGIDRIRQLYGEEGVRQKTLPVFEKGIKELYTIDPRAAQQLAKSSDLELKTIADWVLFPSRVLRGGATSLNLAFAVPNFVRDQISSGVLSKNIMATHNPIAFWAGFKESVLKPTGRATVGRIPGIKGEVFEPSPLFKEYLSRNQNMTKVDLARNLKDATRQAQENLGIRGESILRKYENIISASEKLTRYQNFFGTYKNALKKGIDPENAINIANEAARNNSINFSNRGEIGTFMKIFNPYFNASVQGSRTLAKSLKERPIGTGMKIGSNILSPVAVSTYYNLSDPERAEIYANIPERERGSNIIMVLDGDRGYVKVPLPPGMKEFANPLRNFVESEFLGDRQSLLETAKNIFIDPFSPIGTTANEVISQAVPQAIKPIGEIAINRDIYTGRDIIPEQLKDKSKSEQVYKNTPQIYKDIGKELDISPLQVRKVITGYGAGGLEGALVSIDQLRGTNTGKRSLVEQIVSRFTGKVSKDTGEVKSKFFESYQPLKSNKSDTSERITKLVRSDKLSQADKLAVNFNKKIDEEKKRLKKTYGRFESNLSPLYERLDNLKFSVEDGELTQSSIRSRLRD